MLIKNMLEDVGDDSIRQDNPIPIPNVSIILELSSALSCTTTASNHSI